MLVKEIADGVGALFTAIPASVKAIRKRFWAMTTGVVVGSDLKNLPDFERQRIPNFVVVYEYTVDGAVYSGVDRIPIDAPYHEFDDILQRLTARYSSGESIRVYFSRRDPTQSSVRRGIVGLGAALFFVLVGFVAVIAWYFHFLSVHAKTS